MDYGVLAVVTNYQDVENKLASRQKEYDKKDNNVDI